MEKRLLLYYLFLPAVILIVWWVSTDILGLFPHYILPPLSKVGHSFVELIVEGSPSGTLFQHTSSSLSRVITGFLVAVSLAVPAGVLMGWSKRIHNVFYPLVEIIRPIPPIAWIPLSILWSIGLGFRSAVFIVFIGAFFPTLLSTINGVNGVERLLVEVGYTLGAKENQILRKVVIPRALPIIFTGMRISMGVGWMCVIAAEMVAVRSGLGYLIIESERILRTDRIIVGMLSIGLISLTIDRAFAWVHGRLFKWYGKQ